MSMFRVLVLPVAVTALLAIVSCATQSSHSGPGADEGALPKTLPERALEVPAPTVEVIGDEEFKREYWPNGKIKTEWKTTPSFVVLSEFYESGIKSGRWLSYNTGNGGPGHLKSIEGWDTDGVLCYSNADHFTYVANLSASTDEGLDELLKRPFWLQYLEGIYARRNLGLTDVEMAKIGALQTLKWVDITGCKNITQRGIDDFRKALPNCEVRR